MTTLLFYLVRIIYRDWKCAILEDRNLLWLPWVLERAWPQQERAFPFKDNENLLTGVPVDGGPFARTKCLKPHFHLKENNVA